MALLSASTSILFGLLAGIDVCSAGAPIALGEHGQLEAGLLLQPSFRFQQDGASKDSSWSSDPYLRRTQLQLSGQLQGKLHFLAEAAIIDQGLDGDWSAALAMQDAIGEIALGVRLQLDVGLLLPPGARQRMQHPGSLLMADFHQAWAAAPAGRQGRDVGVMARGELFERRLEYRLSGTAGADFGQGLEETDFDGDGSPDAGPINPDDLPRVALRLAWNFFDPQGGAGAAGYFYRGTDLRMEDGLLVHGRKTLSVGLAVDHQQDALYIYGLDLTGAATSAERSDYTAFVADIYADLPGERGARALTVQAAALRHFFGQGHPDSGTGLYGEVGYRIGPISPVASYELFDASGGSVRDYSAARGGLNWWFLGHGASLKLELGASRSGGGEDRQLGGQLRTQVLF